MKHQLLSLELDEDGIKAMLASIYENTPGDFALRVGDDGRVVATVTTDLRGANKAARVISKATTNDGGSDPAS